MLFGEEALPLKFGIILVAVFRYLYLRYLLMKGFFLGGLSLANINQFLLLTSVRAGSTLGLNIYPQKLD